jgi:glucokinase
VHYPQSSETSSSWKTKASFLGIDLGGTKLSASIVVGTQLVGERKQLPTPSGAENIAEAIVEMIEEFRTDCLLAGVGIATAGIVDPQTGKVVGSTGNLPGWEGTPIKKIIEEKTMLPVHVENDANAAAYGECKAAHLKDLACIIAVTLGTGIGAGIVLDGKLYRGAHFAAGESGHLKISLENQRLCTCGLWDCWETYGSGRGLLATAEIMMTTANVLQTELKKPDKLTTQHVIEAAENGDMIAKRAMDLWHEHICAGLVSLAHTLDPDCFIIGGGMGKFVNYDLLRELFQDRSLPRVGEKLQIYESGLGNDAGMIGAANLVLDSMVAA